MLNSKDQEKQRFEIREHKKNEKQRLSWQGPNSQPLKMQKHGPILQMNPPPQLFDRVTYRPPSIRSEIALRSIGFAGPERWKH